MASRITLDCYQDKAGKWRWRLRAQNGNVVLASTQGYVTLASAGKNLARAAAMLAALNVSQFNNHAPTGEYVYRASVTGTVDIDTINKMC